MTDPDALRSGSGASEWIELSAPGLPWEEGTAVSVGRMYPYYVYADGSLYAICYNYNNSMGQDAKSIAYWAKYDILTDSWSDYQTLLDDENCSLILCLEPYCLDGGISCIMAGNYKGDTPRIEWKSLRIDPTTGDVSTATVPDCPAVLYMPLSRDGSLYSIGIAASSFESATMNGYRIDPPDYSDLGTLTQLGTDTIALNTYTNYPSAAVGNGTVVLGYELSGYGDAQLITFPDLSLQSLGIIGLGDAAGMTANSASMCQGKLYMSAVDHTENAAGEEETYDTVCLCTLTGDVASKLGSTDVTRTATAETGGTATVSDWRGVGSASLSVRENDTATWTAVADAGYTFEGWYNTAGDRISTDTAYSATALYSDTENANLTARFAKQASPSPESNQGTGVIPGTGDGIHLEPVFALLLASAGILTFCLHRRRKA